MALSVFSRRTVLALFLALPLIAAQGATDPVAQYNVTISPWVNHKCVHTGCLPVHPWSWCYKCCCFLQVVRATKFARGLSVEL